MLSRRIPLRHAPREIALTKSVRDKLQSLHERLTGTVLGADQASFLLITALLAGGHVLIQGPPGIGKTTLAATLARSVESTFSRIQFTSAWTSGRLQEFEPRGENTGAVSLFH